VQNSADYPAFCDAEARCRGAVQHLAPFVAAFLSAVGAEAPVDLVGHSAGGAIALRLTLADPARIRTLTLVDSAALGREVHPLLALDTLPGIGELAVMISRMPGGNHGVRDISLRPGWTGGSLGQLQR
jgi:pimeloyl-ACP methyl ester carboxylesterase